MTIRKSQAIFPAALASEASEVCMKELYAFSMIYHTNPAHQMAFTLTVLETMVAALKETMKERGVVVLNPDDPDVAAKTAAAVEELKNMKKGS